MKNLICVILLLYAVSACHKQDAPDNTFPPLPSKDSLRIVAGGLHFPWEILWGPDNHIWMTERNGRISRVDTGTGAVQVLLTIPAVKSINEGGLLGMTLHPDFARQPYVFVVYNYDNGSGGYRERVVRYTYQHNTLAQPLTLLDNIGASAIHNGSRLLILKNDPDKLWITTGDANQQADAQNLAKPNGKILRIRIDGTIPADNPVAGNPMWSRGHRNPQGLVAAGNLLYAAEHGPDIEDEVNIIEKLGNYGWPAVKGPCDTPDETAFCNANQVTAPIWSSGGRTVATSGMDYYNHDFIPAWKNSLLVATLKGSTLYQLQLSANGRAVTGVRQYLTNRFGRLRDVCVAPSGQVYVCTSNGNNADRIIEINKP
ncbi:PQQ-dependent sugar dehydrogenase [Chitinophaga solisilvae]|uniref:PQQ-dependent sugar dehydrogenase n=1 Tax=Chitinophaga solisilvae TaxID=1233460 RepID=UPI00136C7D0E|nr:PQQ-dependent sugar dehydrogenase [Chitinophaga solisilvae]